MTSPEAQSASHQGERGFDELNNPLGYTAVALALLLFATLCFWGSRYVRALGRRGEEERRALREARATPPPNDA